jgi:hypothetical protein
MNRRQIYITIAAFDLGLLFGSLILAVIFHIPLIFIGYFFGACAIAIWGIKMFEIPQYSCPLTLTVFYRFYENGFSFRHKEIPE